MNDIICNHNQILSECITFDKSRLIIMIEIISHAIIFNGGRSSIVFPRRTSSNQTRNIRFLNDCASLILEFHGNCILCKRFISMPSPSTSDRLISSNCEIFSSIPTREFIITTLNLYLLTLSISCVNLDIIILSIFNSCRRSHITGQTRACISSPTVINKISIDFRRILLLKNTINMPVVRAFLQDIPIHTKVTGIDKTTGDHGTINIMDIGTILNLSLNICKDISVTRHRDVIRENTTDFIIRSLVAITRTNNAIIIVIDISVVATILHRLFQLRTVNSI